MTIKDRIGNHTDVKIGLTMLAEDTGLSLATIKRVILQLSKLEWLKVRSNTKEYSPGKFGKDHSTFSLVEQRFTSTPSAHHNTTLSSQGTNPQLTVSYQIQNNNPKQNLEQTPLAKSPANLKLVVNKSIGDTSMNLEEAKQHGINKGNLQKVKNNAVSQLSSIWKDTMTLLYPTEELFKPLTGKEIGMLKLIKNSLGIHANEAFVKVMENWPEYVEYVNDEHGEFKVPTKPFLPYIAANVMLALGFLTYSKKKKVLHLSASPPSIFGTAQVSAQVVNKPVHGSSVDDDDELVTLEEVMALGEKYGLK
jgi:hypothetical protein